MDTVNQILFVPSDDTSKRDDEKFAVGSGCVEKGVAPRKHSKHANLRIDRTSNSDRIEVPTSSAPRPFPSQHPRKLPSVSSNNTHKEKNGLVVSGSGSVRKGIAPKRHSNQTNLLLDRTSVFDRVKGIFMILTACLFLKSLPFIMTIFSMDYGSLDSIVPWMDSNYGNSNLRLYFPMEKHIASLPVQNFSLILHVLHFC